MASKWRSSNKISYPSSEVHAATAHYDDERSPNFACPMQLLSQTILVEQLIRHLAFEVSAINLSNNRP